MKVVARTISYFLTWGAIYGLVFGLLSTTIMLPLIGSMFGLVWGTGIGVACGLLCGVTASLIQAFTFHTDVDLPRYRLRMGLGMGVLVGIIAPLLLIVSSGEILWGERAEAAVYYVPSLIAVLFWGSLSAAYVGHGHPLWLSHIVMRKPSCATAQFSIEDIVSALKRSGIFWRVLALGGFIGTVWGASDLVAYTSTDRIMRGLLGGVAGITAAFVVLLLVCWGAAALIVFLKRLLFLNETMSTTSHAERITLTTAAALLTGVICSWPVIFIASLSMTSLNWGFPILCALMMGFYTYRALPTHIDKAKRKEKNTLALEESKEKNAGP